MLHWERGPIQVLLLEVGTGLLSPVMQPPAPARILALPQDCLAVLPGDTE